MSVQTKRARRRPLALLAAGCVAVATLSIVAATLVPASAGASAVHGAHHKHHAKHPAKTKHHAKHHAKTKHHAKGKPPTKRKPPTKGKPPTNGKPPTPQGGPQPPSPAPVLNGHAVATSLPGQLTSGSFSNSAGTLDYELYVPSTYHAGSGVPLVVGLHGCTQSADSFRQLTGWDAAGQSKNFIVLFPQQTSSRNQFSCWNWFQQANMQRGSGEPAIIDGMVNAVEQTYSIDTHRVYVNGLSAGGAMANVMAATYPDVFAAVGSGSGCEYNGLPCLGNGGPPPSQTGQQAYQAMGSYARVMPAIVFQGDADQVVAPANGPQIVQEWQVTDNYVMSGSANGPIPTNPMKQSFGFSGSQLYTTTLYPDAHGNELIEYWSIHGMQHAWSGGNSSQPYSDPSGPDETGAMWTFFANHPLP